MINFKTIILSSLLIATSCSSIGDTLPFYRYTISTWVGYFTSLGLEISDEEHNSIPYAYIYARIGRSKFSRLILINDRDGVLEWISADKERIFTLNGKIVKTSGLDHDFEILNPKIPRKHSQEKNTIFNIVDFYNPPVSNLTVKSTFSYKRKMEIKNPLKDYPKINVDAYEEEQDLEKIFWRAKNFYYFNSSNGYLEKTIQKIHPLVPEIEIIFVRKYAT